MKPAIIALIGAAKAHSFLENETNLLAIGSGACVNWAGDLLYDLSDFDGFGRSKADETAAEIISGTNSFQYKTC